MTSGVAFEAAFVSLIFVGIGTCTASPAPLTLLVLVGMLALWGVQSPERFWKAKKA